MSFLKVLHVRQSTNIWGPEKGILGLCRAMPEFGFTCEIAIMYRRGRGEPADHPLLAAARAGGVPTTQLDGHISGLHRSIRWLQHKLEVERFSIVHAHDYKTDLVAALARRRAGRGTAFVATVRHTEPGIQMTAFQALDSLVLHSFDRLTIPSEGALRELKRWPALQGRARVIHHAVDSEDVDPTARRERPPALPPRDGGPVILIVGRLQAVKGHRIFLESARKVLAGRPDARFWIAGDGELRGDLEETAARLGIAPAVSFLGYRDDVPRLIAASDIVVSASFYEAFPRNLVEALALAKPVVATATGGTPELIVDEETGILAPPEIRMPWRLRCCASSTTLNLAGGWPLRDRGSSAEDTR